MKRFRGGLVFKVHRLLYHPTSKTGGNVNLAEHLLVEGVIHGIEFDLREVTCRFLDVPVKNGL